MLILSMLSKLLQDKSFFILLLIFSLGAFLRFYRLPEMANFDFDQEYASNFAYSVLKVYPIQLIGQGLSVEGLFMGPWYFYFLVPFFAFFNLHPIGGFVGSVILGLLTIAAYYFIGKNLFSTQAGLIAAFLRAILFSRIGADWTMVPAYSSELAVLLMWFCLYKYWHKKLVFLIPLAFILGMFTSFHPIQFPFYLVVLIIFLIKRYVPNLKTFLLSLVAFIAPLAPLIIFEFLHNFLEVKKLFSTFSNPTSTEKTLEPLIKAVELNLLEIYRYLSLDFMPKEIYYTLLGFILITLIYKKVGFFKDSFHKIALGLAFIIFIVYYYFFPTHVPEYYYYGLFTLSLLYLSSTLGLLWKNNLFKIFLAIILINISLANFFQIKERWTNPSLITLEYKDRVVKEILLRQPKDQEFYVSYIYQLGWNSGFKYLFKVYDQVPQTIEAKSPVYTIVIPRSRVSEADTDLKFGNIGLILPK